MNYRSWQRASAVSCPGCGRQALTHGDEVTRTGRRYRLAQCLDCRYLAVDGKVINPARPGRWARFIVGSKE